jgi:putative aldouronate transport system substrate-binding protein
MKGVCAGADSHEVNTQEVRLMKKKLLSAALAAMMLLSVAACGTTQPTESTTAGTTKATDAAVTTAAPTEPDLPYDFGLDATFHSDEAVSYSMYFSDASWYPMVDTWKTEGVFAKISELTNVTLDVTSYDSSTYMDSVTLDINAGASKYIVPKIYDESAFIDGGAVVAVSDYVQYMPYYQNFVETYSMQPELDSITRADGKYYRLPGMHEAPIQDYTLLIREDIFKAAGYDVAALEKDWTWNDLCDILVGVKAYMVKEGMCAEDDYIWSDLWCGSESGQGNGGNLLKLIGASYGVTAGWGIEDGMKYDSATDSWYFSPITDDYKEFVTVANRFIKEGILDPETFTQEDATATAKFYNGETVIISVNRGQYATFTDSLKEIQKDINPDASTYVTVYPQGSKDYVATNSRLENGVMISKNALEDLGEEGFIQMMRFVDWLWYSPEAYTLIKWGVEGETFEYTTNDAGETVKALLPGFKCGGLGISGAEEDVDIRLQWGYAGGNFWYGHTTDENTDNFIPVIRDFVNRTREYRSYEPLEPGVRTSEEQNEQLNLWKTPLIDNINAWTLSFVTGQKDIATQWEEYVASCQGLSCEDMVALYNEAYKQ